MLPTSVRKTFIGLASGFLASLVVFLIVYFSLFQTFFTSFEADTYDWRMRKFIAPPENLIDDVIILDIDSRTLKEMGPFSQWPRTTWAKVLDILSEAGVRRIGLDLLFDQSLRFADEDSLLFEAIAKHGHVTTALTLSPTDADNYLYAMESEPAGFDTPKHALQIPAELADRLTTFQRMEPESPFFANAGEGIGLGKPDCGPRWYSSPNPTLYALQ